MPATVGGELSAVALIRTQIDRDKGNTNERTALGKDGKGGERMTECGGIIIV